MTHKISDEESQEFDVNVNILQFPVTVNDTTTGHKLQGKSVDCLIIAEWATGIRNWTYVVLSRVKELKNLYLLEELPPDEDGLPDE